jgi:hypothetical protein
MSVFDKTCGMFRLTVFLNLTDQVALTPEANILIRLTPRIADAADPKA